MSTAHKRLIGAIKTAERLGIDPATVRRWAKAGKIPVALVLPDSRQLRFDPDEIEAIRARMTPEASR